MTTDSNEKAHPERYFKARGARLWQEMDGERLPSLPRVLLEEACRLADTLDRLNAMANSSREQWIELMPSEDMGDGIELTITVNPVLAERRQTALALRTLVAELRSALKNTDSADSGNRSPDAEKDGSDEFSRRLAQRIAGTGNR